MTMHAEKHTETEIISKTQSITTQRSVSPINLKGCLSILLLKLFLFLLIFSFLVPVMLNTLKVGENCNVSSNFQTNVKFKAIERVIFFIVKICFLIKI